MSMFEYLKLKESVNALKDNINAVKTDVANVKTELKESVNALKDNINAVKTDVANVKTDLANVKTDLANVKTDLANVKTDLANVKTDVNNMPNNITGFDGVSISDLLNGANKIVFPTQKINLMNAIRFTDILSIDGKGYLSTLNFKYGLVSNPNHQRALDFMIYVDGQILCHITVTVKPYSSSGTEDCYFDFTIVKDEHKPMYFGGTNKNADACPYKGVFGHYYNDSVQDQSPNARKVLQQEFPITYRIGDSVFVADFMKYYGKDEYDYSNVTPAESYEKYICSSLNDILSGITLQKDIVCNSSKTYPRVHAGIYYNDGLGIKFNKNFKVQVLVENPSSADARLTADYILL